MIPPVYNPDWPERVKARYAHDRQEIWDHSILPHIYNCYPPELDRLLLTFSVCCTRCSYQWMASGRTPV